MSKLFFAKLLPVEGEIKNGSKVATYTVSGTIADIITVKFTEKGLYGEETENYYDLEAGNLKLVKLFLCSRDIVVENKSTLMGRLYSLDPVVQKMESEYKVIGEISPEATWVKDGDEFDETEFINTHVCHDFEGNTGYCFHCQRSKGCDSTDYIINVKGPCGHFH
jgi:hypothetical protein